MAKEPIIYCSCGSCKKFKAVGLATSVQEGQKLPPVIGVCRMTGFAVANNWWPPTWCQNSYEECFPLVGRKRTENNRMEKAEKVDSTK